jgi:hypothetical protein
VVVAWIAGLMLAGRMGRLTLPVAVLVALPLAAVVAIRIWSPSDRDR